MNRFNKILIVYIIFISVLLTNICPINAEPTYIKGSAIKPNTFYSYTAGDSQGVQIEKNRVDIANINPEVNPTIASMTNEQFVGEFCTAVMAVSVNKFDLLYLSASGYDKAKADSTSTLICIGMATTTGSGTQKVIKQGYVKNTSWSFTKGAMVYVDTATAGALTTTQPTSGYIQAIGYMEDTNVLYFNPSMTAFQAN